MSVRTQGERSAETKLALNQATIRCLVEGGYSATTMAAVHEGAGVSRGALTHHFSSKQEMMVAAVQHLSSIREREISDATMQLPPDADRAEAVIELLWGTFKSDLFYASLELWNAARTDPALRRVLHTSERVLGARHRVLVAEMFGVRFSSRPGFDRAIDLLFRLMRGAALTRIMRTDRDSEDSVIEDSVHAFTSIVDTVDV